MSDNSEIVNSYEDIIFEKLTKLLENYKCEICQNNNFLVHQYIAPYSEEKNQNNQITVRQWAIGENNIKVHCSKCGNLKYFYPSVIIGSKGGQ